MANQSFTKSVLKKTTIGIVIGGDIGCWGSTDAFPAYLSNHVFSLCNVGVGCVYPLGRSADEAIRGL